MNKRLKKAKTREEKGRMIETSRVLNGQFKPLPKEVAEKMAQKMFDTLDLQTPPDQIDKAPESAMQEKEPFITQDIEAVRFDGLYPNPNGDPFDNMYKRQRKT